MNRRTLLKASIRGAVGLFTGGVLNYKKSEAMVKDEYTTIPDFKEGRYYIGFMNEGFKAEKPQFAHDPKYIMGGPIPDFKGLSTFGHLKDKKAVYNMLKEMNHWESYQFILENYGVRPKDSLSWEIKLDGKIYKEDKCSSHYRKRNKERVVESMVSVNF